ncbi:MAG: hypothetical protein R3C56_06240 [Pirellulaceae bacterium]
MKLELHWQILIGMLLGASIGIAVNSRLSTRQTELSAHCRQVCSAPASMIRPT